MNRGEVIEHLLDWSESTNPAFFCCPFLLPVFAAVVTNQLYRIHTGLGFKYTVAKAARLETLRSGINTRTSCTLKLTCEVEGNADPLNSLDCLSTKSVLNSETEDSHKLVAWVWGISKT